MLCLLSNAAHIIIIIIMASGKIIPLYFLGPGEPGSTQLPLGCQSGSRKESLDAHNMVVSGFLSFDSVKNFVTHFVTPEIWTLRLERTVPSTI